MDNLNALELAALQRIAENHRDVAPALLSTFRSCAVTRRENTGHGFFTDLTLGTQTLPPIALQSPLGDASISVDGMQYGIGCLVFLKNGHPNFLEGFSYADEDTSKI